jgi:hypothetical protein
MAWFLSLRTDAGNRGIRISFSTLLTVVVVVSIKFSLLLHLEIVTRVVR